jgi:hypothetical protein
MVDPLNEHFTAVCKAITDGQIVFFLGAGASLCGRAGDFEPTKNLPSGGELSRYLAAEFAYPYPYPQDEPPDLARITQYIETKLESGPLRDALSKIFIFEPAYPPNVLHRLLARLPKLLRDAPLSKPSRVQHQLLITTNYDRLLEDAFTAEGEPFDVVWYDAQGESRPLHHWNGVHSVRIEDPQTYDALSLEQRSVIFKMHGSLHLGDPEHDSYVITEDHYIDYLTRANVDTLVPVHLRERLKKSHFLFLGSSLRDWNVRAMLRGIHQGQRFKYRGWAIDQRDDELEKKFWDRRRVDFITSPLEQYAVGLSARLEALGAPKQP